MSIRGLMATAAGLAIATGAGPMNSLQAQDGAADFHADSAFINQVAAGNLLEVRLGQMAEQKAGTDAVKQFGKKMREDHTAKQRDWMMAARLYRYPFSPRLTPEQEGTIARLDPLSGPQFERAYMDQMVQEHSNNLAAYQAAQRSGRSVSVRRMAEQGIPGIQEHYNLATQVRAQVTGQVATADPNAPAQQQPGAQPTTPWGNVKPEVKPSPRGKVPAQQPNQSGQQPTAQPVPASTTTASATPQERAAWKADAKFFHNALTANLMQQQLGQMAQTKSENAAVKRFGQMMAKDHAAIQEWWIAAAQRNGETVRPALGSDFRDKVDKLRKRSGKKFDKDYMTLMVKEHAGYLNYFQREGRAARSSDIRSVVNREIPTLWEHYNMAKRVGEQVGADTDPEPRATSSR